MNTSPDPVPLVNMPDHERFAALARDVFASGRLTNNGTKVRELEYRLSEYLGVKHLVLTSSGTLALQIAYRALGLTGEVITTPFSWITTMTSLCWVGLDPRFVDIDPYTCNIDPNLIEAQVTSNTSAILAVHTYGNPSDIDAIERIAARRCLRTVYDAAHAFGVRYRGRSVLDYGDASVLSLHATKLFHTVEGGLVAFHDEESCRQARLVANNGLDESGAPVALGINGRMSELHAAVGLCLLENIDDVLRRRRQLSEALGAMLLRSSAVRLQRLSPLACVNYAYFPLIFPTRELRESTATALRTEGFACRSYFDQPLNLLPFLKQHVSMPITESLSERILCLLLSTDASQRDVTVISDIVSSICRVEKPDVRLAVSAC